MNNNDWQSNYDKEEGIIKKVIKSHRARGVVVIAVGNEHGDTSSNPGRYWLHFT